MHPICNLLYEQYNNDLHKAAILGRSVHQEAALYLDSILDSDSQDQYQQHGVIACIKDEVIVFKCNLVKEWNYLCKYNSIH